MAGYETQVAATLDETPVVAGIAEKEGMREGVQIFASWLVTRKLMSAS